MNPFLDRLSIAAAVLAASAAIVSPTARIVPVPGGVEIVLELDVGGAAAPALTSLLEALPPPCGDEDPELDS